MASGEVSWEDETDVKEIIADVRDVECEMNWVLFGYGPLGHKKLMVLEAGDGDLSEMTQHLAPDVVMYCFIQVAEKVFAFIQWVPENASAIQKAKATVHRSFILTFLGSLAFDIVATCIGDISQEKVDEEISYSNATSGRSLTGADAVKKVEEEKQRKMVMAEKQKLAGNSYEANKRIAEHTSYSKTSTAMPILKAGNVNVARKPQVASLSHSLYSASKVAIEFEDEEGLKDLCLELRELEEAGDFDWMMLGYAEEKRNTLRLLETGNGGREAIVDYVREDMVGALDKVLYLVIKEDYSCNKCTFVCWIGSKVPAFVKANTSTHRGAISEWISKVIHKLQEEYVASGNELLGLKEETEDQDASMSMAAEGADAVNESMSSVQQIDRGLSAKCAGKVLDQVVRDKTPQELWLERKQAKDSGAGGSASSSSSPAKGAGGAGRESIGANGGVHQFTQVVLKKNDVTRPKAAGRSKWSQKRDLANDGASSEHGSEASNDSAISAARTGVTGTGSLAEQARIASEEAAALEREAQRRREQARELEERAKKEQLQDVMGEEPEWSPDDLSEADADEAEAELAQQDGHDAVGAIASAKARGDGGVDGEATTIAEERAEEEAAVRRAEAEAEARREAAAAAQRRAEEEAAEAKRLEAEAKAEELKREEEERMRRKAEEDRKAEEEAAERKRQAEKEAMRKEEEERTLAAEAERKLAEEAEAERKRKAEEEERRAAEEEERMSKAAEKKAEEEAMRRKAEEEEVDAPAAVNSATMSPKERETAFLKDLDEATGKARAEATAASFERIDKMYRLSPAGKENEEATRRPTDASAAVEDAAKKELEAKEARLAAARKALEDARALSSSLSSQRDLSASASALTESKKKTMLSESDTNKPKDSDDDIRRKAEELLARKKALLEEAARRHKNASASSGSSASTSSSLAGDADRLRRAEEYRQRKMAELASKKGGAGGSSISEDAAAKKAAFLKEAEEAVRRASQAETDRKSATYTNAENVPPAGSRVSGRLTKALAEDSDGSPPGTPPSPC